MFRIILCLLFYCIVIFILSFNHVCISPYCVFCMFYFIVPIQPLAATFQ